MFFSAAKYDNDFVILTLCSPIVFYPSVQPICLPSLPAHSYDGVRATTSGWGALVFTKKGQDDLLPDSLMEVNVTTMPNSVCQARYNTGKSVRTISDNMICAMADRKDSCTGDSGGERVQ